MNKTKDIRNRARLSVRFFERDDTSPERTISNAAATKFTSPTSILSRTQRVSPAPSSRTNGYSSGLEFKTDTAVVAYKALAQAEKKPAKAINGVLPPTAKGSASKASEEKTNHVKAGPYIDEYDVKKIEVLSPKYVLKTLPLTGRNSWDSNRSSTDSSTGSDLIARIEARYASKLKALHKEPAPKIEDHKARLETLAKDLEAIMSSDAKEVTTNGNAQKRSPSPSTAIKKSENPSIDETNNLETNKEALNDSKCEEAVHSNGRYVNWTPQHTALTTLPWCCIGDLMNFCDRYEYRSLSRSDLYTQNRIVVEVKALLNTRAPFDMRRRFPDDAHSPENLQICIGRCAGVEYHLNRILNLFRRPLDKLSADKQRMVRHDFHLSLHELRLDISARITEVRLYDRNVFEKEFHLEWQDGP